MTNKIDKTQIKYYRNLARFLYLSKLESEQLTDLANDVLNEDISELKISRPDKVSHKAVPSVMIPTPPSWVAGVDFPLSFSGSRKSPILWEQGVAGSNPATSTLN